MRGAQAIWQQSPLLEQLAVRLLDLQLHRHARQQLTILPLEQDLAVEPLAGAIEIPAAEQIELLGLPGLGAQIERGEIQRGAVEAQHGQVLTLLRQQQAGPLDLLEAAMTLHVRGLHLQPVALLIEQGELHILEGSGAGQGADEHLQLIRVAAGTEPHVAHREVGGLLAPVVVAKGRHHREIDPGLRQLRLLHVDEAGLAAVRIERQGVAAAEHPFGPRTDLLQIPVAHARPRLVFRQKARQIVGLDAEEVDIDLVHVDRADGQAQLLAQRQHHAAGGERGPRHQRPGLDGPTLGGGPQPRLEGHLVAFVGGNLREVKSAAILGQDPVPLHLLAPLAHGEPALPAAAR